MEAWQKVLVKTEFLESQHGKMGCRFCHGGTEPAPDRQAAHQGLVPSPSAGPGGKCEGCHGQVTAAFGSTLHRTSKGIVDLQSGVLAPRVNPGKLAVLQQAVGNHCASCHTARCGDCHVSRPAWSGGGLVQGHSFYKTPNPVLNCTACHGSRVEKEMMGRGPEDMGLKPDVHWAPGGMACAKCHPGSWMHGSSDGYAGRYQVKEAPRCEQCHGQKEGFNALPAHRQHAAGGARVTLQCQVCHGQAYNNCYGCHVGKDQKGLPFFKTDRSAFGFRIGRNAWKSPERPYDYVVVRHVPVARDTFKYYGEDLLSRFDAAPTWKYATPHTIQRVTEQARDCRSCHNRESLFLREKDLLPDERAANHEVVVKKLPPKL